MISTNNLSLKNKVKVIKIGVKTVRKYEYKNHCKNTNVGKNTCCTKRDLAVPTIVDLSSGHTVKPNLNSAIMEKKHSYNETSPFT